MYAPRAIVQELTELREFPRRPLPQGKPDVSKDPCDFRTSGPVMSFAKLVPKWNTVKDGKLVAAGLGFFGDKAWPVIKRWAPPKEVQEALPSARRKVRTAVPVRTTITAVAHDDSSGAGHLVDDDDDLAGVPEEERVRQVVDAAFDGFFTLPKAEDVHVDLEPSLTIETAFINFLRTVRERLGPC